MHQERQKVSFVQDVSSGFNTVTACFIGDPWNLQNLIADLYVDVHSKL
jgi:hypothetical protein